MLCNLCFCIFHEATSCVVKGLYLLNIRFAFIILPSWARRFKSEKIIFFGPKGKTLFLLKLHKQALEWVGKVSQYFCETWVRIYSCVFEASYALGRARSVLVIPDESREFPVEDAVMILCWCQNYGSALPEKYKYKYKYKYNYNYSDDSLVVSELWFCIA